MEKNNNATSNTAETVALSRAEYDALKQELAETRAQNEWLMEQLKLSKKKLYGQSSEKIQEGVMDQLSLTFNEAERMDAASYEPETKVKAHSRKRRSGSVNDITAKDLPVERIEHRLSDEERKCPVCGTEMTEIGSETKRTFVIEPPKYYFRDDVYYTYACKECEKESDEALIEKSPKEPAILPGSFASPEAVAYLMVQKYVMYSPLYRLEQDLDRAGIKLSRQTMSNWILHTSDDWLKPIYDELHRELLKREVLHADETTLQVLKESGKSTTSKCYMWLYRTSGDATEPIVLYDYKPSRKPENAKAFLEGFSGWLHADGYQGYHTLPENIRVVGCMAHARRKFDEALNVLPKEAQVGSEAAKGVAYCTKLFNIEKEIADLPIEEKLKERREKAQPVLDAMYAWANELMPKTAGKSALGKALNYLVEQWKYLVRYLEDGRLELSNNRAERSIKPFVMGRKNWLFANTPAGATSSAVIYSIIETAKENGLDPYRYLLWIFQEAPKVKEKDDSWFKTFLPSSAPESCKV
jgi:transposase